MSKGPSFTGVGGGSGGTPGPQVPGTGDAVQWLFSKEGWFELLGLDKLVARAANFASDLGESTLHTLLIVLGVFALLILLRAVLGVCRGWRIAYIRKQKYG